ncbi:MAG TPA: VCBS repeat-containing protein [Streptosporangiaceae bacterium]
MASANGSWPHATPRFQATQVTDQLREGYWLEAPDIDGDGRPDLMGYGLSTGELYWYRNPEWSRYLLTNGIKEPVGADFADISGNGLPDVVICYQLYGPKGTIVDPDPDGGKIDWLENPGNPHNAIDKWRRHYIGRTVGMHRLRCGHFTQTSKLEVLGLPIVAVEGVHAVIPIVLFTQPDDVFDATEWPRTTVADHYFRFLHGVSKKPGLIPGSDRDSVLLASEEGISWLWYDDAAQRWQIVPIGAGERTEFEQTGFKGSGDVDVGRIGDDPFAFVVAIEPFHGNTVVAYCKDRDASPGEANWTRVVLDVYGDPNANGEGTGHHVVCRDFDGDGDDEILIALRGPWPWQGVFYYKAIDARNGVFAKWRVADESAARIAVGDFSGNGKLDFATIGYNVEHYYVAPHTKIMVYENETKP